MNLKALIFGVVAAGSFVAPLARAAEICITFDNGAGLSGEAEITATDLGDGNYLATAGTLTVTGGPGGTWTLLPVGPGATVSPSGAFSVDDLVFPAGNPVLDVSGLLFNLGAVELNFWGDGLDAYSLYTWNNGYTIYADHSPLTVTAGICSVPDGGATVALLGMSLTGLAYFRRKLA